jgi:hypothetical protein
MDIAQETVKLFSCIRDFRGEASFEPWLYRVVVKVACVRGAAAAAVSGWASGRGAGYRRGGPGAVRSYVVPEMLRWLGKR